MVDIYTDGASKGNPGPGGYGVILVYGEHTKEFSQGYRKTTNNRMELLAAIAGLESLKKDGLDVTIYSDSKYVVDAIEQQWLSDWVKKGFKKTKNPDLWKRFLEAYNKHNVKMRWVKGHADHPMNERCDELAVKTASGQNLLVDEGYEKELGNENSDNPELGFE